jgi:dTDP-glucose pyrophosphorylase
MHTRADEFLGICMMGPDQTMGQAMDRMTAPPGTPMVVVVDQARRLLGVVLDYDIRKAMLNGASLETPIDRVMNPEPYCLSHRTSHAALRACFRRNQRKAVPLIDENGAVTAVALRADYLEVAKSLPNWVLIMAGGFGTRLRPLTDRCPKPMVHLGKKPLLEIILSQLNDNGFSNFMISLHHKSESIRDYFGDGSEWGWNIEFLYEPKPLGTAGCLGLIDQEVRHPLLVMNGDILTGLTLDLLLDFHNRHDHLATLSVKEHIIEVPYGVVEVQSGELVGLLEKPKYRVHVNAGIYVLSPEVLYMIDPMARLDMTDLLGRIRDLHPGRVGCFPINEYWLDIGTPSDHQKAQEYLRVTDALRPVARHPREAGSRPPCAEGADAGRGRASAERLFEHE